MRQPYSHDVAKVLQILQNKHPLHVINVYITKVLLGSAGTKVVQCNTAVFVYTFLCKGCLNEKCESLYHFSST